MSKPDPGNPVVARRPCVNPYLKGGYMVARRLLWDFNYKSWVSRARLKRLKDSRKGGKAVILCNGPSLLKVDFEALDGIFTFGLNKINLLFDKSSFRPSCVVAVNPLVLEQNKAFYNETGLDLFLDEHSSGFVRMRPNVTYLHAYNGTLFAKDCSMSVPQGHTVTYVAMQLAFHMGFRDVALVGCDHTFAEKGPANKTVTSGDKDHSHFDPNYFAHGVQWQLPDLQASEFFYGLAGRHFDAYGGRIINATDGGKLEIFERMELRDWLRA